MVWYSSRIGVCASAYSNVILPNHLLLFLWTGIKILGYMTSATCYGLLVGLNGSVLHLSFPFYFLLHFIHEMFLFKKEKKTNIISFYHFAVSFATSSNTSDFLFLLSAFYFFLLLFLVGFYFRATRASPCSRGGTWSSGLQPLSNPHLTHHVTLP